MEKSIQRIRKLAVVIGCAVILFSFINAVFTFWQLQQNYFFAGNTASNIATFIGSTTQFLWQSSFALILILVAYAIDPAKVNPIFFSSHSDSNELSDDDE